MFRKWMKKVKSVNECENFQNEEIKSFSAKVDDNILFIKSSLVHTEDLIIHDLPERGCLLFIESLVDLEKISDKFLTRINSSNDEIICDKKIDNLYDVTSLLLDGYSIFVSEDKNYAAVFHTSSVEKRAIQEPLSEKVLRGSHDGFIEGLETNIQLIRRSVKNPNLMVRYMTLGVWFRKM
nr:spore germination protein [Bacillus sp. CDB3]